VSTPESPQVETAIVGEIPAVAEDVATEEPAGVSAKTEDIPATGQPVVAAGRPLPALGDRLVQTVGRRKQAIVRVRLVPGSGTFTLNGRTLDQYFPNKVHQQLVRDPLVTVERTESYDVIGTLYGGGTSGQAGALRLAVARALIELDPDDRPALKRAGFLTRDPRVKERKKYGLKKARKAPQYSKR